MAKQKSIWNGVSEVYSHAVLSKIPGMPRRIGYAQSEAQAQEMRDKIMRLNFAKVEIVKRA